jgi:hypothetical protein
MFTISTTPHLTFSNAVDTRIFSPSHTSTTGGNVKLSLYTSTFITDTDMEVSHIGSMTEQAACLRYFISLSSYAIYIRRTLSYLHTSTNCSEEWRNIGD